MADDRCAVFPTPLGWFAAAWTGSGLAALTFGHPSPQAALEALSPAAGTGPSSDPEPAGAEPLIQRLRSYANGHPEDFRDVPLDLGKVTAFQRLVLHRCRRIPYGQTISYGDLAAEVGSPGAARAVGNTMARNRIPLLIPCHRVVGSSNSLGGYSARDGLQMKRRLLTMEGASAR